MTQLEIDAHALATQLDNPASVMIRKLLDEISRLEGLNGWWHAHYWGLVKKLDTLQANQHDR